MARVDRTHLRDSFGVSDRHIPPARDPVRPGIPARAKWCFSARLHALPERGFGICTDSQAVLFGTFARSFTQGLAQKHAAC